MLDLEKENDKLKEEIRYFSFCTWMGLQTSCSASLAGEKAGFELYVDDRNRFIKLCKKLEITPYCHKELK